MHAWEQELKQKTSDKGIRIISVVNNDVLPKSYRKSFIFGTHCNGKSMVF